MENSPQMPHFIGLEILAVRGLSELPVDLPVDRQRSEIRPLGLRSTDPVDRASGTESRALCRSTGPPVLKGVHVCARRSTDFNFGRPAEA